MNVLLMRAMLIDATERDRLRIAPLWVGGGGQIWSGRLNLHLSGQNTDWYMTEGYTEQMFTVCSHTIYPTIDTWNFYLHDNVEHMKG